MKIITRDTDYAIRALACVELSEKGIATVKEISDKLHIPRAFLRKIFQILNKKGILKSFKGKSGGFSLAEDPDKLSVFRLIEIFQGPFCLNEHLFKGETCPLVKTCFLKEKLDDIENYVIKELSSITIGELVRRGKRAGKT
jgi:Rrf2 family protein